MSWIFVDLKLCLIFDARVGYVVCPRFQLAIFKDDRSVVRRRSFHFFVTKP